MIGGPIGAIAGAAVGAGVTYKLSQKAAAKYASQDAEKEVEKHHAAPAKQKQHERSHGKELQHKKEQGQTFAQFLKEFDVGKHDAGAIAQDKVMDFIAKKYVEEGKSSVEKKARQAEAHDFVEVVGRSHESFKKVQAQLKEGGATVDSVKALHKKAHGGPSK